MGRTARGPGPSSACREQGQAFFPEWQRAEKGPMCRVAERLDTAVVVMHVHVLCSVLMLVA